MSITSDKQLRYPAVHISDEHKASTESGGAVHDEKVVVAIPRDTAAPLKSGKTTPGEQSP